MTGFQFTETLSGTFQRDGQARRITFQVTARTDSIWRFLHDRKARLEGVIDAEGLASQAPLHGEIVIDPILGRIIRYDFEFPGTDGQTYHFVGQKDIDPAHPVESLTTLPAELSDASGNFRTRAELVFQTRDLVPFLASFRPVLNLK